MVGKDHKVLLRFSLSTCFQWFWITDVCHLGVTQGSIPLWEAEQWCELPRWAGGKPSTWTGLGLPGTLSLTFWILKSSYPPHTVPNPHRSPLIKEKNNLHSQPSWNPKAPAYSGLPGSHLWPLQGPLADVSWGCDFPLSFLKGLEVRVSLGVGEVGLDFTSAAWKSFWEVGFAWGQW